jgi:cytochrome P450
MTTTAIRDIYTGPSACQISDVYKQFGNSGQMFCSRDPVHREKKKKIVHLFSKNTMAHVEPSLHDLSSRLLKAVVKHKGEPFDLLHWARMLNLDLAGKLHVIMSREE